MEADLHRRLLAGWDPAEMEQRVIADQQKRFFLRSALRQGKVTHWDYQPEFPAWRQYVRK